MTSDELRVLRANLDAAGMTMRRAGPDVSTPPAFVGRVFAKVAVPKTTGVFFSVNPVAILGTEAETKPGVLSVDATTTVLVYVIGSKAPVAGDYLVCRFLGYRWVAERFGATSSCNATLSGTLNGCNFQGFPNPIPGIGYAATQGGAVVASGTTDANGTIAAFVVHSTAPVTITYSGLPGRAGIAPYNVTPVCGSTVPCGTSINLNGLGAYVCVAQRSYQSNYCLYPIATTLHLTSPASGSLVALVYVPSATLWAGSESYPLSPNPCGGGLTTVLVWVYYPDAGQLQCSYRCGSGNLIPIGSATMSHTCPGVSSGFSANGSFSGPYFGGSAPITE